jgi:hypothetical protein
LQNELNDLLEMNKQLQIDKDSAIADAEYAEGRNDAFEIALDLEKVKHNNSGNDSAFDTDSTTNGTAIDDKVRTTMVYTFMPFMLCIICVHVVIV